MRVILTVGFVLVTAAAHAQTDPHALAQRAKAAFDAGDFITAANLLEEAYATKPWPVLLYNLGRAYQQAGAKAKAIDAYERYLREDPSSSDAGAVRESIRQLEDQIARDRELEAQAQAARERSARQEEEANRARAAAREANERAKHTASAWPWITTGIGLGGVAAGFVFGSLALSAHASATSDTSAMQALSDQSNAQTFALLANVLFVVGGTIAVVGTVWGVFDVRLAAAAHNNVHAVVSPNGLVLRGSFW